MTGQYHMESSARNIYCFEDNRRFVCDCFISGFPHGKFTGTHNSIFELGPIGSCKDTVHFIKSMSTSSRALAHIRIDRIRLPRWTRILIDYFTPFILFAMFEKRLHSTVPRTHWSQKNQTCFSWH